MGARERENSKTLILKDSSVRSVWTYLTASPCYTTNTNKHDNITNKERERQTDRVRHRERETETERDRERERWGLGSGNHTSDWVVWYHRKSYKCLIMLTLAPESN